MFNNFAFIGLWGLVVMTAFIGWGALVERALHLRPQAVSVDWALTAGWGLSSLLVLGGVLSLIGIVSKPLVISLVVIGAFAGCIHLWSKRRSGGKPGKLQVMLIVLVVLVLGLRYLAAIHFRALSCGDDDIAYFPFIVRMLETGTLLDPFSMRRLGAYGGQTFLQTFIGALGTEENAYLMDRGVCVIISFGLVLGFFRDRSGSPAIPHAVSVLLVLALPFPMLNSASHVSGLAVFLTLARTLEHWDERAHHTIQPIMLTALIIAAAGSLRNHFLAMGAFTIVFFWAGHMLSSRTWVAGSLTMVKTGVLSGLFLTPWMALQYLSSGSFLYPIMRGNHQPEYENYSAALPLSEHIDAMARVILDPKMVIFLAPVPLLIFLRRSASAVAMYMAAVLTTLTVVWIFTHSDTDNLFRYVAPFLYAAFFTMVCIYLREFQPSSSRHMVMPPIIFLATVIFLPFMMFKDVERLHDRWDKTGLSAEEREQYRSMQAAVPAGESMMVIVNHPFALNYVRNPIAAIDVPGAASPDPGMPYFKGSAAFKTYLLNQGISYLAFEDFDREDACLYNRRLWQYHANMDIPVWKLGARYYLTMMNIIEQLASEHPPLFDDGRYRVIRLDPAAKS